MLKVGSRYSKVASHDIEAGVIGTIKQTIRHPRIVLNKAAAKVSPVLVKPVTKAGRMQASTKASIAQRGKSIKSGWKHSAGQFAKVQSMSKPIPRAGQVVKTVV